jgi:hypothetical protein
MQPQEPRNDELGIELTLADWGFWKHIKTVTVLEAVLLSVSKGLEPRLFSISGASLRNFSVSNNVRYTSIEAKRNTAAMMGVIIHGKILEDRLELAKRSIDRETRGDLVTHDLEYSRGGIAIKVEMSVFGAWAKSKGWDLPDEFPIDKGVVNSQSAVDGSDFDLDRDDYPDGLRIANVAWRAVAVNGQGGEGTPKQRLERWLRDSGNELSDADIGRIASVCNWDKSAGRPKGK